MKIILSFYTNTSYKIINFKKSWDDFSSKKLFFEKF